MDNSWLCLGGIVIVLLAVGLALWQQNQIRKEAEAKYKKALAMLRNEPDNAELRNAALMLGRDWVNKLGRSSTYSEVSIMNDLNAIQSSKANTARAIIPEPAKTDIKTRLAQLESLYSEGVITEAEYNKRREAILSEL
jgi:hypothetical protein